MKRHFAYLLTGLAMASTGLLYAGQDPPQPAVQPPVKAKPRLAFEVATIKPSSPDFPEGHGVFPLPGGRTYVANAAWLQLMIMASYGVTDSQIVGGPPWTKTTFWDVRAKAEHPSSLDDLHEMFRNLLEDRFKLQLHRETRMQPGLALRVDKPGKLTVNEGPEKLGVSPFSSSAIGRFEATRVSMPYLCHFLSTRMRQPIVDETGLLGFYDFTLMYLEDLPPDYVPRPGVVLPDYPHIYEAVKTQLGLKLESQKVPVEVLVIDHVEKPAEN
jgi:uncharacterized protein (TIGR03435 family)